MAEPSSPEPPSKKPEWTRHPDLYMDDGSVVLLAENTVFRVYLKWLGQKSEVFSNLASLDKIQPADSEMYDGCPLIRVSDTAEDLACLLVAMDGCSWYFSINKPTPFPTVATVLRMSNKYMIAPLQDKAVQHLCRIYPTKFEDMQPEHKRLRNEVFGPASGDAPEHPIVLINLVRSLQVTKLLPWAYYSAVRWSFYEIVDGVTLSDGSVARLSNDDMRICLLGFEALLTVQHSTIREIYHGPVTQCSSWSSCSDRIQKTYISALCGQAKGFVGPLRPLRHVTACSNCVSNMKRLDVKKRKEVWEQLPHIFGLPSWAEIYAS